MGTKSSLSEYANRTTWNKPSSFSHRVQLEVSKICLIHVLSMDSCRRWRIRRIRCR
ncbi:uncharacterized protein DS421_2g49000 [Arachis hypogaea]|nr:uncharacterized protein DS421_2g49000 [Arachis hypogaea]